MYSLKGIFPEPKKEQKRNFIKENMKQLKHMQGKATEAKGSDRPRQAPAAIPRSRAPEVRLKKGDVAEFVKNKESRGSPAPQDRRSEGSATSARERESARDVGCQTGDKLKCADAEGDRALLGGDARERIDAILERKDKNRDPYLPQGYQKGVVPKYLRERRNSTAGPESVAEELPSGHVLLPDTERKETLRMLRHSFGELVCELNKLPVRTDTLRARARKAELEARLAKLEDGIRVFSRATVYVKVND